MKDHNMSVRDRIGKHHWTKFIPLPTPSNLLATTANACLTMVDTKESELDSCGNVKQLLKTFNNLLEVERTAIEAIREKLESNDYLGKDGVPEKEQQTISNTSKANRAPGCLVQLLIKVHCIVVVVPI